MLVHIMTPLWHAFTRDLQEVVHVCAGQHSEDKSLSICILHVQYFVHMGHVMMQFGKAGTAGPKHFEDLTVGCTSIAATNNNKNRQF